MNSLSYGAPQVEPIQLTSPSASTLISPRGTFQSHLIAQLRVKIPHSHHSVPGRNGGHVDSMTPVAAVTAQLGALSIR